MGNGFIALIVSAGVAGWVYNKLMRSSGGNVKSAGIAASIVGVGAFIVILMLLKLIPE